MAGYYLREKDRILFSTDVMNESELPQTVFLTMEWEYVDGVPDGWDVSVPVWLDVKGVCLNEPTGVSPEDVVFNATTKTGWTPSFTGDLYLMVPHVHDGNTKQELYLDGKKICESVSNYGESEDFITHVGMYGHEKEEKETDHEHEDEHGGGHEDEHGDGHGDEHEHEEEPGSHHDHSSSDHIMHISSISQCTNAGMIGPSNTLTLTSFYDMTQHTAMKDHDGELEPIMGIEFLHVARVKDEAVKDILAMIPPDLSKFFQRVGRA